ncbi:MAG: hypothetical protein KIT44_05650 [Opitutaceae bacterium]|nr:hypothetical protein [Opitutaceae bacterium]
MKTHLLAPALAALAMFVFGAIYWMSPFPYKVLSTTADDEAAGVALNAIFPETGTYLIPGAHLEPETMTRLHERGPLAYVQFVREGSPPMEPANFLKGYLHCFVVAWLLNFLMLKSAAAFKGYGCRVKFSAAIGVLAAVLIHFSDPIWWRHPWAWHLVGALYSVLVLVVAGLVLAKFNTPKAGPPA